MKKQILIIGQGEIGTALRHVEERAGNDVYMRDKDPLFWTRNESEQYDVVHVAIPFKTLSQFADDIQKHFRTFETECIIIHSTVEVGTTTHLIKTLKFNNIVHSFVRGVHPDLVSGLYTFEKPIGTQDEILSMYVFTHYESIGIRGHTLPDPESSELGKLLSTTYYGWSILFAKMTFDLCEQYGLDFRDVYIWANESYNKGYKSLNKTNVIRPVLLPPTEYKGKRLIGGHCVVPNFKLLPSCDLRNICISQNEK
jgi:hypothetical protein